MRVMVRAGMQGGQQPANRSSRKPAGKNAGEECNLAEDESSGGRGRGGGDQTVEVRCGKACSSPPPAADTDLTDQQRGHGGDATPPTR